MNKIISLPLLPLRGLTVFPNMVLHFDVGREKSIKSLETAMLRNEPVFLVTQKDDAQDEPQMLDLYSMGTIASIRQMLKLPGNIMRVLVEGQQRARLRRISRNIEFWEAQVETVEDTAFDPVALEATVRATVKELREYQSLSGRLPEDMLNPSYELENLHTFADLIAANVLTKVEDKQIVLALADPVDRMTAVAELVSRENQLLAMEKKISQNVKKQIEKNQKDYFLREQLRAIQRELGDKDQNDVEDLRDRLEGIENMPEEAYEKAQREIGRISRMAPSSPEIAVSRNYVETMLDMPWGKYTEDDMNLEHVRKILADDHYGLEKVKERLIEYLAVRQLKDDMKGPILCFVGPPGVGKTSVARSIARAMGRKFIQMSLGGVRDEAELRGHRRTYIGAIPGRVITSIRHAGSMNPLFLFDEIDKMQSDFRGDPAAAMLEILDHEQNHAFRDHFLDIPFDLSRVMFITTANNESTIPRPLLDRMEIIRLSSYTEEEKFQIGKRHLWKRQVEEHGLKTSQLTINAPALRDVIRYYTRESGVRELERKLADICRKSAVRFLDEKLEKLAIKPPTVREMLGAPQYRLEKTSRRGEIGSATGLAWTPVGGQTLRVEVAVMEGTGKLELTGKLGDVMKESARAAYSLARENAKKYHIDPEFYKSKDIHIHVPEGAIPKDGPSAGVTLYSAMISALSERPLHQNIAMTGEITLSGRVLPVGGIKEKTLAAYRIGIRTLLLPEENEKDTEDIPADILEQLDIHYLTHVGDALPTLLVK